jgi:methionine synthase / methylenetetrahydrofolate reductase(NADPH)
MGSIAIQTRADEFRQILENRVLVADGAMGTALYAKGVFINRCYDEPSIAAMTS